MVFDTLNGTDAELRIQPQMEAGHLVENEGKQWTITLREGLRFHDGEPVLGKPSSSAHVITQRHDWATEQHLSCPAAA